MTPLRRLARPLLASIFVVGGADALRNPTPRAPAADGLVEKLPIDLPVLGEQDPETLVKINAGVQVGAGSLLALGRFPRLSSLALALTLVPTTAAGHRFWEISDPEQRKQQQTHFFKNLSLFGALLIASADTAGKPGPAWRAKHGVEHAKAAGRRGRRQARAATKIARTEAKIAAKVAKANARGKTKKAKAKLAA